MPLWDYSPAAPACEQGCMETRAPFASCSRGPRSLHHGLLFIAGHQGVGCAPHTCMPGVWPLLHSHRNHPAPSHAERLSHTRLTLGACC